MFKYFEQRIQPFPDLNPPNTFRSLSDFIRQYSSGVELYLIIMMVCTAIIAAAEILIFQFIGTLIDWMNSSMPGQFWPEHGVKVVTIIITIALGMPILVSIHALISHQTLSTNYPMRVRWLAHKHLLKQSIAFYQGEFAGRLAAKVMQTALAVRESSMKILDLGVYAIISFLSVIAVVANLNIWIALPFIAWLLFYLKILHYFLPKLGELSIRQADANSEMTGRIVDTYTNISTVKLFSHSRRESNYAKRAMRYVLKTQHPQMRLVSSLVMSLWAVNILLFCVVITLSIWQWNNSVISSGAIAIASALTLRLFSMSEWMMWEIATLFEELGTAQDGMNTLSINKQIKDSETASTLSCKQGQIRFEQLCFNYGKQTDKSSDKQPVINDISLRINAGEKVGLVGRSGAGKSTLISLLLRFYDPASGQIFIDEQNIQQVTQDSLRQHISVVSQDTALLHRSVKENLLYSKPTATEEEMIQAAKEAEAHNFILSLRDSAGRTGYNAHVGERGLTLSGGQRQRIAIARALLKNAPILILDEATSALDSEAETAIQENLGRLTENKTVIAIAHRLSTIAAMDRILVVDKGAIVESGTHSSLIHLNGVYSSLWKHQSI